MYHVQLKQEFPQDVETIFAKLSDHNQLKPILKMPVKRIKEGNKEVNGEGSIRRLGFGPLALEETVTNSQTNQRIDYKITKGGAPLKNHKGWLIFTPKANGGCTVTWDIQFESSVPLAGNLIKIILGNGIGGGLKRLAKA